jgi:hypothetical protein
MSLHEERLRILEMIESGQVTAEQGIQLLQALENAGPDEAALPEAAPAPQAAATIEEPFSGTEAAAWILGVGNQPQGDTPPAGPEASPQVTVEDRIEDQPLPQPPRPDPGLSRWRNWWQIPLWIGVGITIIGGLMMYSAYQAGGFSFWFACAWFPFLLGVAVLALAWASRTSPWLHVRVTQKPGERPQHIAFSFPLFKLPLKLANWGLNRFGDRIPSSEGFKPGKLDLNGIIDSLGNLSPEAPLYVQVDEGEDGEKVEVYIG